MIFGIEHLIEESKAYKPKKNICAVCRNELNQHNFTEVVEGIKICHSCGEKIIKNYEQI